MTADRPPFPPSASGAPHPRPEARPLVPEPGRALVPGPDRTRRRRPAARRRSPFGRLRGAALLLGLLLPLAACDDDQPGAWTAEVIDPPTAEAGILLLELSGEGVRAIEPLGGVRLWSAPQAGARGRHRIVLLREREGDPLRFRIEVDDVGGRRPELRLLEGADTSDEPLRSTSAFEIRLQR